MNTPRYQPGCEPPDTSNPADTRYHTITRTFAFLDLSNSTVFLETAGPHATVAAINSFRDLVRATCARRGVRVAKWMGDGVMLVSTTNGRLIATAAEIVQQMATHPLAVRCGIAVSNIALLFDGDDYVGRGVNFAARLCDLADDNQILCDIDCTPDIPDWVHIGDTRDIDVRGMGTHTVHYLHPTKPAS